jgi:hypothetical protein
MGRSRTAGPGLVSGKSGAGLSPSPAAKRDTKFPGNIPFTKVRPGHSWTARSERWRQAGTGRDRRCGWARTDTAAGRRGAGGRWTVTRAAELVSDGRGSTTSHWPFEHDRGHTAADLTEWVDRACCSPPTPGAASTGHRAHSSTVFARDPGTLARPRPAVLPGDAAVVPVGGGDSRPDQLIPTPTRFTPSGRASGSRLRRASSLTPGGRPARSRAGTRRPGDSTPTSVTGIPTRLERASPAGATDARWPSSHTVRQLAHRTRCS